MKINKEQLVELLVQHTGRKKEVVEEQLTELISKISSTAEGESFEIARFGSFSMKDDELHFEPSEELATEVNNKYAGMEPIELIGAYKDSETEEEQPGDHQTTDTDEERAQETVWPEEEDIWGWEETESQLEAEEVTDEPVPEEQPGEQQPAEAAEQGEDQEEITDEPATEMDDRTWSYDEDASEETEQEPDAEPEPVTEEPEHEEETAGEPEPESKTEIEPEPVLATESSTDADDQQEDDKEKEEKTESKPAFSTAAKTLADIKKEGARRGKRNSTNSILVAAGIVIIIAVVATGLWFMMDTGASTESGAGSEPGQGQQAAISTPSSQTPGTPSDGTSQDQSSGPAGQGEDSPEDSENDPNEEQSSTASTETQDNSEPEAQNQVAKQQGKGSASSFSVYGLKGELNSDANDGYTIVVYSLQDQQNAKQMFNGLKQEGYRTMMVPAIIDSTRYWRVGIGQFPSIDEAESTARKLPEPYSNNFFIKRIR